MTLEKLKENLVEAAAQLMDKMEDASPDMATIYLAQSRACIAISKDSKKLKDLWLLVTNDSYSLS